MFVNVDLGPGNRLRNIFVLFCSVDDGGIQLWVAKAFMFLAIYAKRDNIGEEHSIHVVPLSST